MQENGQHGCRSRLIRRALSTAFLLILRQPERQYHKERHLLTLTRQHNADLRSHPPLHRHGLRLRLGTSPSHPP